jgi:hypothetical protein
MGERETYDQISDSVLLSLQPNVFLIQLGDGFSVFIFGFVGFALVRKKSMLSN